MTPAAQLRKGVSGLAVLANRDLARLWQEVGTAVEAKQALADVLPHLVDVYGTAAAALAADWYDELRAKRGVPGRFGATPAEIGNTGTDALAGVAAGPLFSAKPDWSSALVLAQGGLQRRIANQARSTVMLSSVRDPRAHGWRRVGDGSTCDFCSMLLGRGAVYTEATADFPAHDHCGCGAEPAF